MCTYRWCVGVHRQYAGLCAGLCWRGVYIYRCELVRLHVFVTLCMCTHMCLQQGRVQGFCAQLCILCTAQLQGHHSESRQCE